VLPTSLAAPVADLLFAFGQIAAFAGEVSEPLRHMLAGINLEGTFIKDAAYAGAQNPDYFYPLDRSLFEELQTAAGGLIRIVNLPPDHGLPGCDFTHYLSERGVVVAGGHSGATADQFDAAVAAGLRLGVHFLNGPSKSSSKSFHGGGAVESMLSRDEVSLELIVDGYHVAPAYVRDVIARKGPERVILITDSVFVNGCEGIQHFSLSGIPGQVSENGKYLQVLNKADTLFGSVLRMDRGFANVLHWLMQPMTGVWIRHHEALSPEQALIQASRMASAHPAKLLGIYEQEGDSRAGTGSIEAGKWADVVLAEVKPGPAECVLRVEWTACRGAFTKCS
jgi:N-acetylglucosamine-6-phosphate deacetylase